MAPQWKILGVIPVSLVNPTAQYCFQVSPDLLALILHLQQCFHYLSKYVHLQRMGDSTEHKYTANPSALTKFPGFSPIQLTSCFRGFDNLPTLRICIQEGFLCWMCFPTLLLYYSHTEAMTHGKGMFYFNNLPSNIFSSLITLIFFALHRQVYNSVGCKGLSQHSSMSAAGQCPSCSNDNKYLLLFPVTCECSQYII